jgi:hypothetical protein
VGDARIVDEHGQRPGAAQLGDGVDALIVGQIGHDRLDGDASERRFKLIEPVLAAADDDHVKAPGGEFLGVGFADPGGGSRDEREVWHRVPFCRCRRGSDSFRPIDSPASGGADSGVNAPIWVGRAGQR